MRHDIRIKRKEGDITGADLKSPIATSSVTINVKCGRNFRPREACRRVGASPKPSRIKRSNALKSKESSLEKGLRSKGKTETEGEYVKGDVIT